MLFKWYKRARNIKENKSYANISIAGEKDVNVSECSGKSIDNVKKWFTNIKTNIIRSDKVLE